MTKEEAHGIYQLASAICLKTEDAIKLCVKKGVPEKMVKEFIEEDEKFNAFLNAHDDEGNLRKIK
jgi:hypothetical protein